MSRLLWFVALALVFVTNSSSAAPPKLDALPGHAPPFRGGTALGAGIEITSIAAGGYRVVSFSSGATRAGLASECDARGADIIQSVGTYVMIAGICEDGTAKPCDGRFTLAVENCGSAEGAQLQISSPPVLTQYRGSAFYALYGGRVCFDPTGDSDCLQPDSDALVIAEIGAENARGLLTEIEGQPTGEIQGSSRLQAVVDFPFEGEVVRMNAAPFSSQSIYERIDVTNLKCGLPQFGLRDCAQTYMTRRIGN